MPIDDYSPIYVGDTLTPLVVQFLAKDGTVQPLAGATFGLVMVSSVGERQVGTGTWTIDNVATGQAHYAWGSADVAIPGSWMIQASVTIGGQTLHTDPKPLMIDPLL